MFDMAKFKAGQEPNWSARPQKKNTRAYYASAPQKKKNFGPHKQARRPGRKTPEWLLCVYLQKWATPFCKRPDCLAYYGRNTLHGNRGDKMKKLFAAILAQSLKD